MPRELLPELISEILLRLPVKSILRFRCLSNSIRNEIDSPDFARIHLNRSIETESHRKLIFSGGEDFYAALKGLKNSLKFNDEFPDPDQYTLWNFHAYHGLFLLCATGNYCRDLLLLWNPATRLFKMLPPCPYKYPISVFICYGLEYDSATDDYNVVVDLSPDVDYFASPFMYSDEVREVSIYGFCVFSLKLNSWRKIWDLHLDRKIIPSDSFDSCDGLESLISLGNDGIFQVAQASTQTSTSMQTQTPPTIQSSASVSTARIKESSSRNTTAIKPTTGSCGREGFREH